MKNLLLVSALFVTVNCFSQDTITIQHKLIGGIESFDSDSQMWIDSLLKYYEIYITTEPRGFGYVTSKGDKLAVKSEGSHDLRGFTAWLKRQKFPVKQ